MPKDPNAAAAKWQSRLAQAASDGTIAAGIERVNVSPGQLAARQADVWAANTAAAKSRFAANSGKVTLEAWKAAAKDKGVTRIADGASKSQDKMASFLGKLIPAVDSIVRSAPARGTFATNLQRMTYVVQKLHDSKGSFT